MYIPLKETVIRDFAPKDAEALYRIVRERDILLYMGDWAENGKEIAEGPSCRLAKKCGFTLFEKRLPLGHKQSNIVSDSYYYYRLYRK